MESGMGAQSFSDFALLHPGHQKTGSVMSALMLLILSAVIHGF